MTTTELRRGATASPAAAKARTASPIEQPRHAVEFDELCSTALFRIWEINRTRLWFFFSKDGSVGPRLHELTSREPSMWTSFTVHLEDLEPSAVLLDVEARPGCAAALQALADRAHSLKMRTPPGGTA